MSRRILIVALLTATAACSTENFPRFSLPEEHCSIRSLDGWTRGRQLGSMVFSAPEGPLAHDTIAIRTAPVMEGGTPRTADRVFSTTAKVLAALPGAEVGAPKLAEI